MRTGQISLKYHSGNTFIFDLALIKAVARWRSQVLTEAVQEPAISSAFLAMYHMYEFHLRSEMNFRLNRLSSGDPFIVNDGSLGYDRRCWNVTSFAFEALNGTSQFYYTGMLRLHQMKDHISISGHQVLWSCISISSA